MGKVSLFGILAVAVVLLVASALKVDLGLPTFVAAIVVASLVLIMGRSNPVHLVRDISWSVLPLVAALFVIVEAVKSAGALQVLQAVTEHVTQWPRVESGLALAGAVGFGANIVNNLPLGLIAGATLHSMTLRPLLSQAVLIGIDLGPNLSITLALSRPFFGSSPYVVKGCHVSGWQFLKAGMYSSCRSPSGTGDRRRRCCSVGNDATQFRMGSILRVSCRTTTPVCCRRVSRCRCTGSGPVAAFVIAIAACGDVIEVSLVLIKRRADEPELLSKRCEQSRIERRNGRCASNDGGRSMNYDVIPGVGVRVARDIGNHAPFSVWRACRRLGYADLETLHWEDGGVAAASSFAIGLTRAVIPHGLDGGGFVGAATTNDVGAGGRRIDIGRG